MIVCGAMIISLDTQTQLTAFVWMIIGLIVFFTYSQSHSNLNKKEGLVVGSDH